MIALWCAFGLLAVVHVIVWRQTIDHFEHRLLMLERRIERLDFPHATEGDPD